MTQERLQSHITGGYEDSMIFLDCKQYKNDYDILYHFPFYIMINPITDDWNKSIAHMDYSNNFVSTLTLTDQGSNIPQSIFCLKELKYLIIKNMIFTNGVVPDTLVNLQRLRRLEISNTVITNMTNQLSTLTRLSWLILINCSLYHMPNLSNMSDLSHVLLEQNYLSKIDGLNSNIYNLLLSNNLFTEIPILKEPTYLEELIMDNNPLKHIMMIDSFINLKKVDLHNTTLLFILPTINKLQKIEYLDLSYNKLFYLPEDIRRLNKLNILYVNNNSFSNREIQTIKSYFDISHPNITLRI